MITVTNLKSQKIQILRGLAIIAVVLIHNTPAGLCQVFVRPFLNFCVGMFLFLSGILSDASKLNMKKRLSRVLIPYALWTVIYVVLYNLDNISAIPVKLIYNLFTARGAITMYYIFVYCFFTLLIPVIDKLARSKYKYLGFVIAPVEILLLRTIPDVLGHTFGEVATIFLDISFLGWFTYFYLGYLLGNGLITFNASNKKLTVILIISLALQILEGYLLYSAGIRNCGTQLKLTAILTGVLIILLSYRFINSDNAKFNSKLLQAFGNCSFGIFFAHLAIMAVLEKIIPAYESIAIFPLNGIIAFILSFVCVLAGKKILGKWAKYLGL